MEIVRRRCTVGYLDIILRAQLQKSFEPRGTMLWSLAFVAVGKQHDEAVGAQPLAFARCNKLINYGLRAVDEIAKLSFPHHQ